MNKLQENIIKEFEEKFFTEESNLRSWMLKQSTQRLEQIDWLKDALSRVHNAAVEETRQECVKGTYGHCEVCAAKLNELKREKPFCNHKWREIENGEGDYREFGKQCVKCNDVIWD